MPTNIKKIVLVLILLGTTSIFFQNCSAPIHESLGTQENQSSSLLDPVVEQQALGILAARCASCHSGAGAGGVGQILDVAHLIATGLIVPGAPGLSPIILSEEAGRMPPGQPLSAAEQAPLRQWVAGNPVSTANPGAIIPPVSVPTTPAPPTVVSGTLEQKAITILQNACYSCHGTTAAGGLNQITDAAYLISAGQVVPGNALGSKLYQRMLGGTAAMPLPMMPPAGKLNAADLSLIADWINAGAAAPAPGTTSPPPTLPPLAATYASIQANILGPKCIACHGPTRAEKGVRYDSYTLTLATVTKTLPLKSLLFTICESETMPLRPAPKLTANELTVLSAWITAGAANN